MLLLVVRSQCWCCYKAQCIHVRLNHAYSCSTTRSHRTRAARVHSILRAVMSCSSSRTNMAGFQEHADLLGPHFYYLAFVPRLVEVDVATGSKVAPSAEAAHFCNPTAAGWDIFPALAGAQANCELKMCACLVGFCCVPEAV